MANCKKCGKQLSMVERLAFVCHDCLSKEHEAKLAALEEAPLSAKHISRPSTDREIKAAADVASVMVTTETAHNLAVTRRLDIITAECVFGMNIFKDIGAGVRDVIGGRNEAFQETLRDARKTVLFELRHEAWKIGADAVVGVDLDYSEVSDGGKSMIMLVASGTAVVLAK